MPIRVDDESGIFEAKRPSPVPTCSDCDALIDVSDQEPLAKAPCPQCAAVAWGWCMRDATLDRYVAIKLRRKDRSGNEQLNAQLAQEAAITASVPHPPVVKVFTTDLGNDRFFLAMEPVNTGSLGPLIKLQGRISELQALDIGIQIAQPLSKRSRKECRCA